METFDQSKEHRIGDLIRFLLKKHSLSMRKLSSLCGMDAATISRIVNGKQQPKLIHLKHFSEHLDISLDQLIEASGYEVVDGKKESEMGILNSLDAIRVILGNSKLFDPEVTTARIEQELIKYEQYSQTEEGHRMICHEFNAKVNQVNGVGPFIEHLKEMYMRYCDEDTSVNDRSVLGSALLYFILSADIIPDYIFPIGYLDDAIAVYLVLDRLNQNGYTA
ncbi:DUF1232 domain-containing protein [Paenibacillus sp. N3/727]|uniref:DUF1232 domain-containing protein n=1 Tax=Paenibacillus sp. N3/727 TaxID=2925845 RepID=UPI001F53C692|nr:DUF1232 domain-containing protein [Paenibacillus sp. N3/727]UNK16104.1 DUF1232 domain-containing protein [Paenibacillus sp. N3/727]